MARALESQVFGAHRPQTLTGDMILHGIGIMRVEPEDFRADRREALLRAIERAYTKDQLLGPTMLDLARRIGNALKANDLPMQGALRVHLGLVENGAEDRQMKTKVAALANVVPSLVELTEWL